jgi:hypothetical protein
MAAACRDKKRVCFPQRSLESEGAERVLVNDRLLGRGQLRSIAACCVMLAGVCWFRSSVRGLDDAVLSMMAV